MKKQKHTNKYTVLLLLLTCLMLACSLPAYAGPKLNKKQINVPEGTKFNLKLNGVKGKVKWTSSNKKIATVSAKGVVTGKKGGRCNITAQAGGKKYTCSVKVIRQVLKLNASANEIGKGTTLQLNITVKNAKSKKVIWKSDDTSVASVSAGGLVTGLKSGTATITAALKENKKVNARIKVTVKTYVSAIIPNALWKSGTYFINAITPPSYEHKEEAAKGGTLMSITGLDVSPEDADDKTVLYSSSDPNVATVDKAGNSRPVGTGTAVITATAADGGGATLSRTIKVVDMKEFMKTETITKDNFLTLFGLSGPYTETETHTDAFGDTRTEIINHVYFTNRQFDDGWVYCGPGSNLSSDCAVELAVTYQYTGPEGNTITRTGKMTFNGRIASFQTPAEMKILKITNIEITRIKDGSSVRYINRKAFPSISGVKQDSDGVPYTEMTDISGQVYRDYEGHALKGSYSAGTSPWLFVEE